MRLADIDLNALMIFHAVVEQGSIQKAKDTLGRTQPAITLRLNKLEAELGKKLFLQKKPNLKLTPEGETLFKWTTALKKHVERSPMAKHGGFSGVASYPLRIGTYTHISAFGIPPAMAQTAEKFPDLLFTTLFDDPYDLIQKLKSGSLDVIVLPKHFNPSNEVRKQFSVPQNFFALIPHSMKHLPLDQMKWCYYQSPKDPLLQTLNNVLTEIVARPDIRWEISKLTSVVSAVETQTAAAIVPSFLLCHPLQNCEARLIKPKMSREIPLEAYVHFHYKRRPNAKAVDTFCDYLKESLMKANRSTVSRIDPKINLTNLDHLPA